MGFARKLWIGGTRHNHGIAADTDWRHCDSQRPWPERVVDNKDLIAPAEPCTAKQSLDENGSPGGYRIARARHFNRWLVAQLRHRHIDDVGVEHRKHGGCHAVGDLPRVVVLPNGRQRRERNEIADATLKLVGLGKLFHPRHIVRPPVNNAHRTFSACPQTPKGNGRSAIATLNGLRSG